MYFLTFNHWSPENYQMTFSSDGGATTKARQTLRAVRAASLTIQ